MPQRHNGKFVILQILTHTKCNHTPRFEVREQVTHDLSNLITAEVQEAIPAKNHIHLVRHLHRSLLQ
jgi:hypothetical protein